MDSDKTTYTDLPPAASEYIDAVIKKMRYRKKIRADVRAELTAHFEDALRDCDSEDEKTKLTTDLIAKFGEPKLLAKLIRRGKKRCRAKWRTAIVRMFQGIGILFLGLIVYCVYISFAQPNIRVDYISEMTNINRPVVDEDFNAAVLYQKAIDSYVEQPKIMHEIEPTGDGQRRTKEMELLTAIDDKQWIGDLTEEEAALLRQWIANNDEAIEYFLAGSDRPYCWWERKVDEHIEEAWMACVLLPELRPMKKMVKLICWQAKLKASDGEVQAGFNDLLKCYKASEHLKGPRTLISQLVGISIQTLVVQNCRVILCNTGIDAETLKAFQEQFEVMQSGSTYVTDYEIESFLLLDFIQRVYTDDGDGGGRMIPRGGTWEMLGGGGDLSGNLELSMSNYAASLSLSLVSADRKDMTAEVERVFHTAEKWTKMTPWQLRNSGEDLDMGFDKWSRIKRARYWPVLVLTPALSKVSELSYRNRTEIEALIAVIAILRYEKEKGTYPETLEKLIDARYLRKMPMDPCSDKSLRYDRKDDSFILYSFGENYADDDGMRYRSSTWGKDEKGDKVFWPVETYQQQKERRENEKSVPK